MNAESISAVANCVTAVAALVAAGFAGLGLRTWRQQLVGQAEYEVARRVLRAVLEVRDQIGAVRNPFMSAGEMALPDDQESAPAQAFGARNSVEQVRAAYDRRWSRLTKAESELGAALIKAEVLWGQDLAAADAELRARIGELFGAVLEYVETYDQRPSETGRTRDQLREMRAILYARPGAPTADEFGSKVNAVVSLFEARLRPHLRRLRSNESLQLTRARISPAASTAPTARPRS